MKLICCPKVSNGNPQTIQSVAEAIGCSPQREGKALLLKKTLIQLSKHREVVVLPMYDLYPYGLVFLIMGASFPTTKGET